MAATKKEKHSTETLGQKNQIVQKCLNELWRIEESPKKVFVDVLYRDSDDLIFTFTHLCDPTETSPKDIGWYVQREEGAGSPALEGVKLGPYKSFQKALGVAANCYAEFIISHLTV